MKISTAFILFIHWTSISAIAPNHGRIPVIEGPIKGGQRGYPYAAYYGDISKIGYVEEEYFLSGTATRYDSVGNLTSDGKWTLQPSTSGAYKTRILVHRPRNPAKFNGVALLEWINVSFGYEISFGGDARGLYEDGSIYILVSAQRVGIVGYSNSNPQGLKQWDSERYGSLNIEDDALSYDIYTQVARLVKSANGQNRVLAGLRPRTIVAVGGSQSGGRILSYTNGVQPIANVFDVTMPLLAASNGATVITRVRTDLQVPVWTINSELEASITASLNIRQPDTQLYRLWEVAGASHVNGPLYQTLLLKLDRDGVTRPWAVNASSSQVNWLPVVDAAFRYLPAWVHNYKPPPSIPLISTTSINGTTLVLERGVDGNVIGGVRMPELRVPIAEYIGLVGSNLNGETIAYNSSTLTKLYPTHQIYVGQVTLASREAQREGIILDYQVALEISNAKAAAIPC
ncbi:hypothetical protein F5884DRAFT_682101 [Xylogone sp. PMI_703]|nr:hypothetical protein F5884DRAFT_682101 [Xylogone sp. PMI_703]